MDDRTKNLLMSAAKAAGILIEWYDDPRYDSAFYTQVGLKSKRWNPLEYDHDLIGLARKLKININYVQCCASHILENGHIKQVYWGAGYESKNDVEAIVVVAAFVGNSMP